MGAAEAEQEAGRQAACSGWYRQNSSVLSSCLICVLATSRLAVDEAEIMGWICKPISWAWLLPPLPSGTAQEGRGGLGGTSLATRSHMEELVPWSSGPFQPAAEQEAADGQVLKWT